MGGALSPFLWLMFSNGIHEELRTMRLAQGEDPRNFVDLVFADDVTTLIMMENLERLGGSALGNVRNAGQSAGNRA